MKRYYTYGLQERDGVIPDFKATDISLKQWGAEFRAHFRGKNLGPFRLAVPGIHNVSNALVAIAIGIELEVPVDLIAKRRRDEAVIRVGDAERDVGRRGSDPEHERVLVDVHDADGVFHVGPLGDHRHRDDVEDRRPVHVPHGQRDLGLRFQESVRGRDRDGVRAGVGEGGRQGQGPGGRARSGVGRGDRGERRAARERERDRVPLTVGRGERLDAGRPLVHPDRRGRLERGRRVRGAAVGQDRVVEPVDTHLQRIVDVDPRAGGDERGVIQRVQGRARHEGQVRGARGGRDRERAEPVRAGGELGAGVAGVEVGRAGGGPHRRRELGTLVHESGPGDRAVGDADDELVSGDRQRPVRRRADRRRPVAVRIGPKPDVERAGTRRREHVGLRRYAVAVHVEVDVLGVSRKGVEDREQNRRDRDPGGARYVRESGAENRHAENPPFRLIGAL
ncbi:MAG TPA: Mur ligase family protein [Acidobacteriota bacterium]|nr:Mur ligase family protein [Acidobacteriota bacterium]